LRGHWANVVRLRLLAGGKMTGGDKIVFSGHF
jgi:hypothetical protein